MAEQPSSSQRIKLALKPINKPSHSNALLFPSPPPPPPPSREQQGEGEGERGTTTTMENEEAWLMVGLVIRVQNAIVGEGRYRGKIGLVQQIIDTFGAQVCMVDSGDILKLDQDDCMTVLPSENFPLLIVRGEYRGTRAKLIRTNLDSKEAEVELEEGPKLGHSLIIPQSHLCKHIAIVR